jgi:hypothetical protein
VNGRPAVRHRERRRTRRPPVTLIAC